MLVTAGSALTLAVAISMDALITESGSLGKALESKQTLGLASSVCSAAGDICTTIFVLCYLRKTQNRAHFPSLSGTIARIVRITVSTGCLTAILATMSVVSWKLLDRANTALFLSESMVGKMYVNALLTRLNMRGYMGATLTDGAPQMIRLERIEDGLAQSERESSEDHKDAST